MILGFKTRQSGFTLMELMVVMLLMSLLITLVAPIGINMVDKAEAQTEYVQLQNLLKHQANHAFVSGSAVYITLEGNKVIITHPHRTDPMIKRFEHLQFGQSVELFFNRNGVPSVFEVPVQVGNIERVYALAHLWHSNDAN